MYSQSNKQRVVAILALCLFIASLFGCSLPGFGNKHLTSGTPTPTITPIVSSFQPAKLLQVCLDTKPLVPDPLFRAATAQVSDMLDSSVNVNSGAWQIYISYIVGSNSYLKEAFS